MGKEARMRAQARAGRRERLRLKFPNAARDIIENRAFAHLFLATAPLIRMLIEAGVSPTHNLGLASHDAMVAIVKDALGIDHLDEEGFEHALRLATPPECRGAPQ